LLAGLLLLALATEVVQLLVPGREAGWLDVGLNIGGALLGVGLAQLGSRRRAPEISH
jgi:VanZ family protein